MKTELGKASRGHEVPIEGDLPESSTEEKSFAYLAKNATCWGMRVIASEANRLGLSKNEFASLVGTDRSTLSRYFGDRTLDGDKEPPRKKTFRRLLQGLGVKPELILIHALREELNVDDEIDAIYDIGRRVLAREYHEDIGIPEYEEMTGSIRRIGAEKRREILSRFIVRVRIIGARSVDGGKGELPLHAFVRDLTLAGFHPSPVRGVSPADRRAGQRAGYLAYEKLVRSLNLRPEDIAAIRSAMSECMSDYPLWDTLNGISSRKEREREYHDAYGLWPYGNSPKYQDETPLPTKAVVYRENTSRGVANLFAFFDVSVPSLTISRDPGNHEHVFIVPHDAHGCPQDQAMICIDFSWAIERYLKNMDSNALGGATSGSPDREIMLAFGILLPDKRRICINVGGFVSVNPDLIDHVRATEKQKKKTQKK